jgi:hypothetical protein
VFTQRAAFEQEWRKTPLGDWWMMKDDGQYCSWGIDPERLGPTHNATRGAEQVAGALANMCFDSPENRDAVREEGGIDALVSILQGDPRLSVAETAATAVANLCFDNECNRRAVRAWRRTGPPPTPRHAPPLSSGRTGRGCTDEDGYQQ